MQNNHAFDPGPAPSPQQTPTALYSARSAGPADRVAAAGLTRAARRNGCGNYGASQGFLRTRDKLAALNARALSLPKLLQRPVRAPGEGSGINTEVRVSYLPVGLVQQGSAFLHSPSAPFSALPSAPALPLCRGDGARSEHPRALPKVYTTHTHTHTHTHTPSHTQTYTTHTPSHTHTHPPTHKHTQPTH